MKKLIINFTCAFLSVLIMTQFVPLTYALENNYDIIDQSLYIDNLEDVSNGDNTKILSSSVSDTLYYLTLLLQTNDVYQMESAKKMQRELQLTELEMEQLKQISEYGFKLYFDDEKIAIEETSMCSIEMIEQELSQILTNKYYEFMEWLKNWYGEFINYYENYNWDSLDNEPVEENNFANSAAITMVDSVSYTNRSIRKYSVLATQFEPNGSTVETYFGRDVKGVALPDKLIVWANQACKSYMEGKEGNANYLWGLIENEIGENKAEAYKYQYFTVDIKYNNTWYYDIPIVDCGPWNFNDNYWDGTLCRRKFYDLSQGTPEAEYAKKYGYNGGLDEKGRTVSNEAGLDITTSLATTIGFSGTGMVYVDYSSLPNVYR